MLNAIPILASMHGRIIIASTDRGALSVKECNGQLAQISELDQISRSLTRHPSWLRELPHTRPIGLTRRVPLRRTSPMPGMSVLWGSRHACLNEFAAACRRIVAYIPQWQ